MAEREEEQKQYNQKKKKTKGYFRKTRRIMTSKKQTIANYRNGHRKLKIKQ